MMMEPTVNKTFRTKTYLLDKHLYMKLREISLFNNGKGSNRKRTQPLDHRGNGVKGKPCLR